MDEALLFVESDVFFNCKEIEWGLELTEGIDAIESRFISNNINDLDRDLPEIEDSLSFSFDIEYLDVEEYLTTHEFHIDI